MGKWIKTFLLLFIMPTFTVAQDVEVKLDGKFCEWDDVQTNYIDTENDGKDVDFVSFSVTNDDDFLYIYFRLSKETLINAAYNLYLEIDTDNNFWTGYRVNGIGAELGWSFGGKKGYFNIDGTPDIVKFSSIGLRCLPSVTSRDFELAIKRDAKPDGIQRLFPSDTIRLCFYESSGGGDLMPNDGEFFTYVFQDNSFPVKNIEFDKAEEDIRLLTYNVLNDGLLDEQRKLFFKKIIAETSPDIITFNECWNSNAKQVENFLKDVFPNQTWKCLKADEGNVTCSVFEQERFWNVLPGARITAVQYKIPGEKQKHFIVINTHLKCCNSDDIRQNQADALAAFILDGVNKGGVLDFPDLCPFVISGDLNLVGDAQQLKTLLSGEIMDTAKWGKGDHPDWDNSQLKDEIARHTDKKMAYTWRNDQSDYWPGRLDYHLFSNSVMTVAKSFVLCTETMTKEHLDKYQFDPNTTSLASDHLPRVSDFRLRDGSSRSKGNGLFRIKTNPDLKQIDICPQQDVEFCRVHLMDSRANHRAELYSGKMKSAEKMSFRIHEFEKNNISSCYILIDLANERYLQKFVNF